jgi:hypothetical protein
MAAKKKSVRQPGSKKKVNKAITKISIPKIAIPKVPSVPPKPKKNYKLPNYKKKCIECHQFKFIKGGWSLCMQCYEKRYGKYQGDDRYLYVK